MTEYVAGFLFDRSQNTVVLIRKNRPDWQVGMLNGVGGHIDPGESADDAMRREFREEAGLDLDSWEHYASLTGDWGCVWFYRAFVDHATLMSLRPKTDEPLVITSTRAIPGNVVPNLHWLLPMAMHASADEYRPILARTR